MAGKPPRPVDRQDCASRAALPWPAGRTRPTGDPRLAAQMVAVGFQGVADGRSSLRVIRRLPPDVSAVMNAPRRSAGRRRISLEGGNRGSEAPRGVVGDGYGDLMPPLGSCVGRARHKRPVDDAGCGVDAVRWTTVEPRAVTVSGRRGAPWVRYGRDDASPFGGRSIGRWCRGAAAHGLLWVSGGARGR